MRWVQMQTWTQPIRLQFGEEKFEGNSAGVLEIGPFIRGTWEVIVPNFGQSSQCLSSTSQASQHGHKGVLKMQKS